MSPGAALSLALLAPAPASPAGRTYEGPAEVESPAGASEVDTAAAVEPAPTPSAPVEVRGRARASGGAHLVDDRRPEREDPQARAKPRLVPRILTTLYGWYPGEEAIVSNRSRTFHFTPGVQARSQV